MNGYPPQDGVKPGIQMFCMLIVAVVSSNMLALAVWLSNATGASVIKKVGHDNLPKIFLNRQYTWQKSCTLVESFAKFHTCNALEVISSFCVLWCIPHRLSKTKTISSWNAPVTF